MSTGDVRRHLLALGAIAVAGAAVVGELVGQVRELTRRLGLAGNACATGPAVLSTAAVGAEDLLNVSGIETGDAYLQSTTLNYAGMATMEHGHPDDGLKMLQFGLVKAWDIPGDEQRAVVIGVSGRSARETCSRRKPRPPWPLSENWTPPMPKWRSHGSSGRPPALTTTATSIVPLRCWRCAGDGWTLRNRWLRRRCSAGKESAQAVALTPASCWPPSMSGRGNLAASRWPTH
jgi:hypothetical protein